MDSSEDSLKLLMSTDNPSTLADVGLEPKIPKTKKKMQEKGKKKGKKKNKKNVKKKWSTKKRVAMTTASILAAGSWTGLTRLLMIDSALIANMSKGAEVGMMLAFFA